MAILVAWTQATGVSICSNGITRDDHISLNLSTEALGDVCCCSYTVAMTDVPCTNLSSRIEYDCSFNVSLDVPSLPACGVVNSWSNDCIQDRNNGYSICVGRNSSGPVQFGMIHLRSEATMTLTCSHGEPVTTRHPHETTAPEDTSLKAGAITGIVVGISVVIVAVVCFVFSRVKLRAKDKHSGPIHDDDLFGDDGNDVVMPKPIPAKHGADNSGYYQGAATKKTGVRVPRKQPLRVDSYLRDQNGKSPYGHVPRASATDKEEANFVY
ncbi:uncharacterized protein [Haliotis asinina]|uniref:uncharacterized protein n=1 Tax=Haliotis asinina TaxID=109174 RepID=UPI003532622A